KKAVLWAADNDNHRLLRLNLATATWQAFGQRGESLGQFQYPFQLAQSGAGDVLITDVLNSRIQLFHDRGNAVRSIGVYGVEPGELYRPSGVAVDRDSNTWVADSVVGVIQLFRADGSFLDVLREANGAPLRFASPMGIAFDSDNNLYVVELQAD